MQNLIPEQPYQFVPPRFSRFWAWLVGTRLPSMLQKRFGVCGWDVRHRERLAASFAAGHGVLLAPNHSRPSDPFLLAALGREMRRPVHIMATRHIFVENAVQAFLLPRIGNFSINREITDHKALRCAEKILAETRHPLVMFPEGLVTRTNDHLIEFQRGVSLVARRAAARSKGSRRQVVVHPVFLRYTHCGDTPSSAAPVLSEVEERCGIRHHGSLPLRDRILKTGEALLAEKEREYLGRTESGPLAARIAALLEEVLSQVERRRVGLVRHRDPMARTRIARAAIVRKLAETPSGSAQHKALWEDIAHLYLVQQLHCYPAGYLGASVTNADRLLEMVEHFEEDLTDKVRPHPPLQATIWIGEAIPVSPSRRPKPDPIMTALRLQMEELLAASGAPETVREAASC